METTAFELNEMLKEGILQGILWTNDTVQRTATCLDRMSEHHIVTELTILDNNRFVPTWEGEEEHGAKSTTATTTTTTTTTTFRTLMKVLARYTHLKRLSIAHGDLSSVLVDIAEVYTTTTTPGHHDCPKLEELELMVAGNKIRPVGAVHLRHIVRIPSQTLSLSFHLKQKDYGPVLHALRQGLDDLQGATTTTEEKEKNGPPRILFRNVSFPDHEYHLHRFMAMVCQARCVHGLQLNPRRCRVAHDTESMRVGEGFLPAIARLLASDDGGALRSLDVSNLVVDPASLIDEELVRAFRRALAINTSLQRLSMPSTKGMSRIWQEAVFPVLATTNRTIQRLEFGHEPGIVASFLHHLPQMRGLISIQAPWRTPDGPAWMATVPLATSLCHVHFQFIPNVQEDATTSITTTTSKSYSGIGHKTENQQQEEEEEDCCLTQTRQGVERHRLMRTAHEILVQQPPETAISMGPLVDHLIGFVQATNDVGLDARYILLRESLAALVASSLTCSPS